MDQKDKTNLTKKYSPEFKLARVLEFVQGQKILQDISREHHIDEALLAQWQEEFIQRAPSIFSMEQAEPIENPNHTPAAPTDSEMQMRNEPTQISNTEIETCMRMAGRMLYDIIRHYLVKQGKLEPRSDGNARGKD